MQKVQSPFSGRMQSLDQIQRWMQTVIMNMGGARAGVASDAAQEVIGVAAYHIEQVVTRSRALDAFDRLDIYNRSYFARLIDCLREEFPAVRHAVGDEAFDAFALGYLRQYPSRSYTLNDLGKHFGDYLLESRPDDGGGEAGGVDLGDFITDLATLEQTYAEVFDGPGVEGQRLLSEEQLAKVPAERWLEARLMPVVCLRLLSLRYPVHRYFSAVRAEKNPPYPRPRATYLAVTRRQYVIRRFQLTREQFTLLAALVGGETIGTAIERVAHSPRAKLDALADKLRRWFTSWTAEGFFERVELGPT